MLCLLPKPCVPVRARCAGGADDSVRLELADARSLAVAGRALRARQAAAGPRPTVRDAQARPPPPPLLRLAPDPGPRLRLTARALVATRAHCACPCARWLRACVLHGRAAARAMLAVLAMLTACAGLIMFMFMLPASAEGPSHLEVPLFEGESKAPARE